MKSAPGSPPAEHPPHPSSLHARYGNARAGGKRAEPFRPVQLLTPQEQNASDRYLQKFLQRQVAELHHIQRGLLLGAGIALLVGLCLAGADRVFPPGWWMRW